MDGKNPVFIKGNLKVGVEGEVFEFVQQNITLYGVTSLPGNQKLRQFYGKYLPVVLEIPNQKEGLMFHLRAKVLREISSVSENVGLQFELSENQRALLSSAIASRGFSPVSYVRKYPRIPSMEVIQTFPLHALVMPLDHKENFGSVTAPFVMDVVNLSPNGLLLKSESQMVSLLHPGYRIKLILEPRGWFPVQIEAEALVCRVTEEMHENQQGVSRYFGVKLTRMTDPHKVAFQDLLRDIVRQLAEMQVEAQKKAG